MSKYDEARLFLRAARGERTERTPIWLMRQAGRSDPEYRKLRAEIELPLHEIFRTPEHAARISLLPKRLGVDALIVFQDILTPLAPLGAEFTFAPGPALEEPIRTCAQVDALRLYDVAEELAFVRDTFGLIHEALDGELPVLGFAGAPLTLACFMVEGRGLGKGAPHALRFLTERPDLAHTLLGKLATLTIDYLRLQVEAGAAALQLFESAACLLPPDLYREFALPYQQRIFEALRSAVPTILFARDWTDLAMLDAAGADVISLPAAVSIAEARACLGAERPLQGNLDNHLLARGPLDAIRRAADACLAQGQHRGHIFNLSHGLLPDTPYKHVQELVAHVRETQITSDEL